MCVIFLRHPRILKDLVPLMLLIAHSCSSSAQSYNCWLVRNLSIEDDIVEQHKKREPKPNPGEALHPDSSSLASDASWATHRNCHVNAEVSVVSKKVCSSCIKNEAVAVADGHGHPVMDGAGRCLPGQPVAAAMQLQSVLKVLCLLTGANEQHGGKKLLVTFTLLLFLQHQHEVVAKARLHHHPVHCPWQVNVCGKENDVFSLKGGNAFVGMHEVGHHGFQGSLPVTGGTRARAGVGTVLTDGFMFWLFCVVECQGAACCGILERDQTQAIRKGTSTSICCSHLSTGNTGEQPELSCSLQILHYLYVALDSS